MYKYNCVYSLSDCMIALLLLFLSCHGTLCLEDSAGVSNGDVAGEGGTAKGLDSQRLGTISENSVAYDSFDDSIYYKIKWTDSEDKVKLLDSISEKSPANHQEQLEPPKPIPKPEDEDENILWVTTAKKERYYCILPSKVVKGDSPDSSLNAFDGLSPYQILKPLFTREVCSYRLEQYWTYELCHGRYVRQFHEESTVQKVKGQEYYLGKFDLNDLSETEAEFERQLESYKESGKKRPTITFDGVQLPYIEFNMTGGTLCDLSNKPRMTRVRYVCSEDSKHELYSIKETFTCEYEAIVLSPLLCLHTDFRINIAKENEITCFPVDGAPPKPSGLTELETKVRREKRPENLFDGKTIIIDAAELSGKETFGLDISIRDENGNVLRKKSTTHEPLLPEFPEKPKYDSRVIKEFLRGELCLQGGTGWWKYEFCYGDKVVQYHEEKGQRTATIVLGKWNKLDHKNWLDSQPSKRIKPGKTPRQVSHFYGKGDACAESDEKRQVEVKLKCKHVSGHTDAVALYLLEPKTCQYVLGIESSIVCHLLSSVDEDGIMHLDPDYLDEEEDEAV